MISLAFSVSLKMSPLSVGYVMRLTGLLLLPNVSSSHHGKLGVFLCTSDVKNLTGTYGFHDFFLLDFVRMKHSCGLRCKGKS